MLKRMLGFLQSFDATLEDFSFYLYGSDLCFSFRLCTTGLPSDVIIQVGEMSFHLHKVHFCLICLDS